MQQRNRTLAEPLAGFAFGKQLCGQLETSFRSRNPGKFDKGTKSDQCLAIKWIGFRQAFVEIAA